MKHHVALSFDLDAIALWIGTFKATNVSTLSRGEFDAIGIPRILKLLQDRHIPATFFVPGHTALAFRSSVDEVVAAGHEIAHHGFVHERITELTPERELEVLRKGIEILSEVTGRRPVGYRSPSWDFTTHTTRYLLEHDFLYDSSMMATDFTPYWPRVDDQASADAPYVFGRQVPLVEIPVAWELGDAPHFLYVRGFTPGLRPANDVYDLWSEEYKFFRTRVPGGCYTLTLHPQISARGYRLMMLERLVDEMLADGATFSTLETVARAWKAEQTEIPRR
ncbi:MAG: peptidoglycan-N-acetylglucosamine deacetylase [Chloroflexota bacterium]|jgi:peptidoglycan/xylan/chitin deacetylase (PgdA/CDA1 family)|nr:peptidoglycan-N-acetylglucosamine deacetylase [Chloroflexota bacterium]